MRIKVSVTWDTDGDGYTTTLEAFEDERRTRCLVLGVDRQPFFYAAGQQLVREYWGEQLTLPF